MQPDLERQASRHGQPSASAANSRQPSPMLGDPEDTLRPTLSFPMRHPDDVASGTVSSVATVQSSVRALVLGSYLNALLVFLPFGYIAKAAGWVGIRDDVEPAGATFALNFLAIVPLSKMLGYATEEIAIRTGNVVGGLLNASFGNAVELIISIAALKEGLILVVQSSLIGSILSNLLLVLGMCFLLGGLRYSEQSFSVHSAQTSAALLALSSLGLVLPAAFDASTGQSASSPATLAISRGTSLILLIVYGLYLYFQLKTHRHLYESPEVAIRESAHGTSSMMQSPATNEAADASLLRPSRAANAAASEEEKEEPTMMMSVAIASLVIVTILVAVSAEFMVSSIEGLTASSGLNEAFIGMVIVPIVGNAAEHVSAITVAMKNKMDLAISVAIGSSTQIALLITPLITIIGWMMGQPMTLDFHPFSTVVLFISVLVVNYLILDGKSNWLEGSMLLASYAIVSISYFYYEEPGSHPHGGSGG